MEQSVCSMLHTAKYVLLLLLRSVRPSCRQRDSWLHCQSVSSLSDADGCKFENGSNWIGKSTGSRVNDSVWWVRGGHSGQTFQAKLTDLLARSIATRKKCFPEWNIVGRLHLQLHGGWRKPNLGRIFAHFDARRWCRNTGRRNGGKNTEMAGAVPAHSYRLVPPGNKVVKVLSNRMRRKTLSVNLNYRFSSTGRSPIHVGEIWHTHAQTALAGKNLKSCCSIFIDTFGKRNADS